MDERKPSRQELLGIRVHRAVRRRESRGGCDLCGEAIESDVHNEADPLEVDSGSDLEKVMSVIPKHRDGTLCTTAEKCSRAHDSDDHKVQ